MSLVTDAPNKIPRAQLAQFITDSDDAPIDKVIQDFEDQQIYTTETVPGAVEAAQATADSALLAAASAQSTANNAAAKLAADTFITLNSEAATLPQSRQLLLGGPRLQKVDGGAGAGITLSFTDLNPILPADVTDVTAAFVNATGLLAALAINSTYIVEGLLTFQSANVAVGIGLTFTLPAGATISGGFDHNNTTTTLQAAFNIASGGISANTTAVPVANTNTPIRGRWIIKTGATAGNAQLQFRSGLAATLVTLKQDLSILRFIKVV